MTLVGTKIIPVVLGLSGIAAGGSFSLTSYLTNKPKKRQKNQCDSFAKKESWGTRSPHYQPLVWISLVENYAETILKDYGLISGNTKYKTSNGTWETGPWSCTIEKSLDNLLVSCDFYENKQIT
ncbi:hypothetical protein MSUIS_02000 [Mycoplasma suis KI3806]|uniref:Uncharacterized protein n=1 Tax=Mycoplasma suis (strain KI_3806) TaxID=708248 RepID=F0V371_MYCS3|nr:hypothetical protein [Mycoplasma suis]CBZ40293.1 hypothetical protein MSUIS_02000 [Mycoplasma suis KI3806]